MCECVAVLAGYTHSRLFSLDLTPVNATLTEDAAGRRWVAVTVTQTSFWEIYFLNEEEEEEEEEFFLLLVLLTH